MTQHRHGDAGAVTFGIEEEFVLLDPRTLAAVDRGLSAVEALSGSCAGVVVREFFPSQIEYATPVCTTSDDALADLVAFRRRLAAWAHEDGVIAAGSGTPFTTDVRAPHLQGRYASIAHDIAGLTVEHQLNGLHVHVGIADRDAGVRSSNFLRPWLPVILALAANSPFWLGRDTGFCSWRAIHSRRWTTHGIPPYFADAREYDAALHRLAGVGATSDAGTINWMARLSASHPTLEIRVCDAQLSPQASVALALIIRALVVVGGGRETPRSAAYEGWDAALWHAARHGMSGSLVDPTSARLVSASCAVDALRAVIDTELPGDDARLVDAFLSEVAAYGDGASRQRRAQERGRLAALYRDHLTG